MNSNYMIEVIGEENIPGIFQLPMFFLIRTVNGSTMFY